ncbi:MAG TPA: signal peptidase II [Candidatus Avacidaminococcus intestinavium]|uniref:Lipoprotein signal peptidase n=1 Tax=Candidatus Avacidaminococcus intestinavium TaxID=2840684 RepID=A0A9D1MRL1_9FIRM|nr:signal peptidase II [Candidatus Avacidaminococcus intestinavium]
MLTLLIIAIVVLDQMTKFAVVSNMNLGSSIPIVQDFFHLTYILNAGAAFGILENSRYFFVGTAIIVLLGLIFFRKFIASEPFSVRIGIALFAGGTLGNLIDRIRLGMVIDFFDFRIWPIFNIADIAICVGVGLIIWSTLLTEMKTK